jgi:hypothetical protein
VWNVPLSLRRSFVEALAENSVPTFLFSVISLNVTYRGLAGLKIHR